MKPEWRWRLELVQLLKKHLLMWNQAAQKKETDDQESFNNAGKV